MKLLNALVIFIFCLNFLQSTENYSEKKIIICGVCKNVEKGFEVVYKSVNKLKEYFSDYRVIVYENNSTDQTKNLYKNWVHSDSKVIFLSEDLTKDQLEDIAPKFYDCRIEYISRARNLVLDEINKNEYQDFEYVLMADLDDFELWDIDGIIKTINNPEQEWDAVFANGSYDVLAFRTSECAIGPESLGFYTWAKSCFFVYQNRINQLIDKGRWIPVKSAFGGLAIYKKDSIKNCRYNSLINQQIFDEHIKNLNIDDDLALKIYPKNLHTVLSNRIKFFMKWQEDNFSKKSLIFSKIKDPYLFVCEHVLFHSDMIKNGHDKLFVNPNLIMKCKSQL